MKPNRRLELVVTDGERTIRSFWLEQQKAGIYGAFISPRLSIHRSYHADGNVHYRVEGAHRILGGNDFFNPNGYSKEVIKSTPLNIFKGSFDFFNGGLRLDKEVLEKTSGVRSCNPTIKAKPSQIIVTQGLMSFLTEERGNRYV